MTIAHSPDALHSGPRQALSFRSVNRRGSPAYDPAMQRHHLLPREILSRPGLARMIAGIGRERIGFDDFRANGLLLPAQEWRAVSLRMPLHRGPHRHYNEVVIERVGAIERHWSRTAPRASHCAARDALMRLALLRAALRRRLLSTPRSTFRLSRKDPVGTGFDFTELDAMADTLWRATG